MRLFCQLVAVAWLAFIAGATCAGSRHHQEASVPGVNQNNVVDVFTYHAPTGPEQLEAYQRIRERGLELAREVLDSTPVCGDQQAAIRKIREAVMTANAAIALGGGV